MIQILHALSMNDMNKGILSQLISSDCPNCFTFYRSHIFQIPVVLLLLLTWRFKDVFHCHLSHKLCLWTGCMSQMFSIFFKVPGMMLGKEKASK